MDQLCFLARLPDAYTWYSSPTCRNVDVSNRVSWLEKVGRRPQVTEQCSYAPSDSQTARRCKAQEASGKNGVEHSWIRDSVEK